MQGVDDIRPQNYSIIKGFTLKGCENYWAGQVYCVRHHNLILGEPHEREMQQMESLESEKLLDDLMF